MDGSVRQWLEEKGYSCSRNISIGSKFPDIVSLKGSGIIAVEFKKGADISKSIGNALHYMQKANIVYIAMPEDEAGFLSEETKKTVRSAGIGIMSVSSTVDIIVEPKNEKRDNSDLVKSMKNSEDMVRRPSEENHVRERIIELLRGHAEGLSIMSISKHMGITRQTASRYVLALISEGVVKIRKVGPAKLCHLRRAGMR